MNACFRHKYIYCLVTQYTDHYLCAIFISSFLFLCYSAYSEGGLVHYQGTMNNTDRPESSSALVHVHIDYDGA